MRAPTSITVGKVPQVTIVFWILKVAATTLGETGGDAVSMSLGLGYLLASCLFLAIFVVAVVAQVRATRFHPWLYWSTIVATTTVGTTVADFADRSLGIGYAGGSALLLALVLVLLATWYGAMGSVSIHHIVTPRAEWFYWITIMFSQTLGTALGDWTAGDAGIGYFGSVMLFGGLLAVIAVVYSVTRVSRTLLFWMAFVLTRPLGAAFGDFLDKPLDDGGLALSRYAATAMLLAFTAICIWLVPQRPADTRN